MSEEPAAAASGLVFQEIRATSGERVHKYRSMNVLTWATLALVGLNGAILILQLVALAGRWALLAQAQAGGFS